MEQRFSDWPGYEKNSANTDTEKTLKKLQNQVFFVFNWKKKI